MEGTPKTDALATDCFGPEQDWTPNQKRMVAHARELERELEKMEDEAYNAGVERSLME